MTYNTHLSGMHPTDKAVNQKTKKKKGEVHAMIFTLTLLSFENDYTLDSIGGFIHSNWYFFNTNIITKLNQKNPRNEIK